MSQQSLTNGDQERENNETFEENWRLGIRVGAYNSIAIYFFTTSIFYFLELFWLDHDAIFFLVWGAAGGIGLVTFLLTVPLFSWIGARVDGQIGGIFGGIIGGATTGAVAFAIPYRFLWQ